MTAGDSHGFEVGCLVVWQPHGIYGCVVELDHRRMTVEMDGGDTKVFTTDADVLERVGFEPGSQITRVGDETVGVILGRLDGDGRPTWRVSFPGQTTNLPECAIRPAEVQDPMQRMRNGELRGRARDFNLKSVAADLWTQHLHNELVSLDHARVDLRPHQVAVAHRVVTSYPHRFLLCDEVGLGKTIEAAMVVKELRARKQVQRVLVLVPSGLQRQWQFELKTKFNETFAIYNKDTIKYLKAQGIEHPWTHHDQVIVSHTWAAWSKKRRAAIASVDWDLIIVDEAHHAREQKFGAKARRTNLYRLVRDLVARPEQARRPVLFLTATPMQLQRHELYSLVDLLDPILFASEVDFTRHVDSLAGLNRLVDRLRTAGLPDDTEGRLWLIGQVAEFLRLELPQAEALVDSEESETLAERLHGAHRLSEILIRNRRAVVGGFQPRSAYRWPVAPTDEEEKIYEMLDEMLAAGFALAEETRSNAVGFLMTTFQKLAASSSRALLVSLQKRLGRLMEESAQKAVSLSDAEQALDADVAVAEVVDHLAPDAVIDVSLMLDLISLLSRIRFDSKARKLASHLSDLFEDDPEAKVLIFTQFRETQAMLKELLEGSGWGVHLFHGQLRPEEKDQAVEDFRSATGPQILVSTEAGGEGRNFQFCHLLVNYDLPWNPMRVEQRIGRVDRIGQEHPVIVFNLFVEGTIEERVLDVLEHRINLFTEAIGGLEPIIGDVESDIRKAIRLAGEARDEFLRKLAEKTERRVKKAREAERKMADFIMDSKSFAAEIARMARHAEEPVEQADYEQFLRVLLQSVNTYLDGPDSRGVYKVMFHSPFTFEHGELLNGQERRRVCFDPRSNVDSEAVEYLGFGHPIIDTLTESRIRDWPKGSAAIRHVAGFPGTGWQFNWLVTVGGVRPRRLVHPVFVPDGGTPDRDLGAELLRISRRFDREEKEGGIDVASLNSAHEQSIADVATLAYGLETEARRQARERADEERSRIEAAHGYRLQAAQDKLGAARQTLARLQASELQTDQAVVPLWRANVERAEAELVRIDQDRAEMLADLSRRMTPTVEYQLLNVARVVGEEPEHP